jgi:hypothetical protein
MSRYTALSLIPLPRVSATAAVALGAQVLSAAEGQKKNKGFPRELSRPIDVLTEKHAALAEAVSSSVVAPEALEAADLPALDRDIDGAWSGTDDRLAGLAKLPGEPKAIEAAALRARLFPMGLKFLTYDYKREWAESKARLDRIDAENLGPALDRLAGKEFLAAIRRAHTAYGDALGLTAAGPIPIAEESKLRVPLDAFMHALRRYVNKVVAAGDDDTKEGAAMMRALLWPLDAWTTPGAKRGSGGGNSGAAGGGGAAGDGTGEGAGKGDPGGQEPGTGSPAGGANAVPSAQQSLPAPAGRPAVKPWPLSRLHLG